MKEMSMREYRKLIWCSCGAHAICVSKYGDDVETYISLWAESGMENHRSLRSRIRDSWSALRGKLFCDDVILLPKEVAFLKKALREA